MDMGFLSDYRERHGYYHNLQNPSKVQRAWPKLVSPTDHACGSARVMLCELLNMPRITRWFPVSHDINSDPDLWKAREEIGEKAFSIWIEFLSISDRNEGYLPGDYDQLMRQVSVKCRSTQSKVRDVWDFALSQVWVKCDPHARVVNYAKYHRTREPNEIPRGELLGSPPNQTEPSEPSLREDAEPASPHLLNNKNGLPEWYEVAERLYQSDKPRFERLFRWANGIAGKGGITPRHIRDALLNFERFEHRNGPVEDWYPYLKKVLEKTVVKANIKAAELKHKEFKKQEAQWAENLKSGKMTPQEMILRLADKK